MAEVCAESAQPDAPLKRGVGLGLGTDRLAEPRGQLAAVYVKGQLGHTDATVTLDYYAREMDRREGEPERLRALLEGRDWTPMDSRNERAATAEPADDATKPVESGILLRNRDCFRSKAGL